MAAVVLSVASCAQQGSEEPVVASSDSVRVHTNVVYGQKLGMALTLDVFEPAMPNGAGVVFLNSGGYTSPFVQLVTEEDSVPRLTPEGEFPWATQFSVRRLVERGYTVFNMRHGSTPRFLLPEIVDDVRRGLRYVLAHSEAYGVDSGRIGVWGGSSGGHLALMLGLSPERCPAGGVESECVEAPLAAVVAYYPPAEFGSLRVSGEEWAQSNFRRPLTALFPSIAYPQEQDPEMSPVHYATADDPPTLIVHGDQDEIVPLVQGRMMHEELVAAGVESELVVIEGAAHPPEAFVGEDAEEALAAAIEWFDRHLVPSP